MIYYRRYVEAYQGDTADLSMLEDGAYNRLLDHYYKTEAPIALGRECLVTRAMSPAERKATKAVLERFFEKQPDGWHNARADHEIAMAQQARENGGKSPGRPPKTGPITGSATGTITGQETGNITAAVTADGTGSGQPDKPTSTQILTPPTTLSAVLTSQPNPVARRAPRTPPPTAGTWDAYHRAYLERYGTEPVRNAKVNRNIVDFVNRIGVEEAPHVAAFYVSHNRMAYVRSNHDVGLMLHDAEGLRTEWARARPTSDTEARQTDRTMAVANAFAPLLAEAERTEAA